MNEAKPDINKIMFMHLVSMLAMSAIQQMGKLVDPDTGKAAMNLEAAQATIDMLDMLEARTRGNLDAEETRLLKDTLMSLKMNYVESQDQKTDPASPKGYAGASAGRQTTEDGPAKAEGQTPDTRHQTTEKKGQEESGQKSANAADGADDGAKKAGNEDKTPKYHKKYE